MAEAAAGSIAFLANPRYRRYLQTTGASAVILREQDRASCPTNVLISDNPYLAFARIAAVLHPQAPTSAGIHPSAVVDEKACVAPSARVGANCVIEAGAEVGPGCDIGPLCFIGRGARIGANTRLVANVTVCDRSVIGERCRLHPGAVIGSDGFGLANDAGTWVRVPQTGRACLGDDVDVGANTTIDRGTIRDTVVGDGVKLDNQIQLAHNVEVGARSAMAACTGISGSTRIGRHCTLAGAVGVVGHVEIADGVHVSGMSMVSRSLAEPGVYTGSIPAMPHDEWRRNFARLKQLDDMARRLRRLESQLAKCSNRRDD